MFSSLSSAEIKLVQSDFRSLLQSPEATKVTLWYKTYLGLTDDIDPVYGVNNRTVAADPVQHPIRCIQKIVHERDIKILAFGILEIGDAIFYFDSKLNLQEPRQGSPAVPESLIVVDPSGIRWEPVLKEVGPLYRHLVMRLGQIQVSQPVACTLER